MRGYPHTGARRGYRARMLLLIVVALIAWLALVIIGLAVKTLFWLFIAGAILFVVTAIGGAVHHRTSR